MNESPPKANLHVAIRASQYADPYGEKRLRGNIIEDHNAIVAKKKRVLLGKLGRKPDPVKLDLLRISIKTYHNAKLFVIRKRKSGYDVFAAPINKVYSEDDFVPELSLIPSYYHYLVPDIKLWFEIGQLKKLDDQSLQPLVLLSSGKSLLDILSVCRTSLMFVLEQKPS